MRPISCGPCAMRRTQAARCKARPSESSSSHRFMSRRIWRRRRAGVLEHLLEHRLQLAGERLITSSTSDVAVCCSSDSESSRVRACTSSNSRTLPIAITAWSAKVCSKRDLLVAERLHFGAAQHDRSDALAFAQQRHARMLRMPAYRCDATIRVHREIRPSSESMSCTCTGFRSRTARPAVQRRIDRPFVEIDRYRAMMGA